MAKLKPVQMTIVSSRILAYTKDRDIIIYSSCSRADLIVMATHGLSGLKRWAYGGVADKVQHGADLPFLLLWAHLEQ